MKIYSSIIAATVLCSSIYAQPIAKEDGFSGFVAAGVTTMKYESNMYAGTQFDDKMTDEKIDSIDGSADSESSTQPSFNFNVKYTFADAQTEIYLGTLLEDAITFDSTAILGVRKHFDGVGIFALGLLGSSVPTKTYKDPYKTGSDRGSTDMTSSGISLKWEGIMDSNFDVELRARKYDIDGGDKSGQDGTYHGDNGDRTITSSQADELDREGDLSQLIMAYRWNINKRNHLRTAIRLSDYDLDGKAMEHTRTGIKLDYLYLGDKWNFVAVMGAAKDKFDNGNPLYNSKKADADTFGGAFTAMYKNPFNIAENLSLTATVAAYNYDSDIDFYDGKVTMLNLGVLYKF